MPIDPDAPAFPAFPPRQNKGITTRTYVACEIMSALLNPPENAAALQSDNAAEVRARIVDAAWALADDFLASG